MKRQHGAALLIVLWLVALLTALVGAFALTARMEALQGRVGSRGAVAQEIARSGMEYALVRVADRNPETHWQPNGRAYAWKFDGHDVQVRIIDETGKVDLNQADVSLLSRLMQVLGQPSDASDLIAAAIVDWRDADNLSQPVGGAEDGDYAAAGRDYGAKDAPFETIAEVEQVLGMTPTLYAQLAPFLTLYSGRGQPDATYAQGPVLAAMGMDATAWLAQRNATGVTGSNELVGTGSGTYSIESRARLADGREASLWTVVRAGASPVPGSAYTLLRWEEGAAPQ
ncbi:general secretion pathway protein GspK [Pseudoxanthomonas sp. PXM03]|uniref:general secretion pathway protein GspK n=1 Tax=Pseudoxanthomonas sp. PXM03 TaxID=2769284 RepID=UPI0017816871|nr:type II secretion system protein GspK [Pseudoxanthomonas sp. PXM03]MBD9435121.1 general secretion pathway protein GspK [Pseudoxanthomonas sp. PXM03]